MAAPESNAQAANSQQSEAGHFDGATVDGSFAQSGSRYRPQTQCDPTSDGKVFQ